MKTTKYRIRMNAGEPTIESIEETIDHSAPQGYKRPSTGTEPTVKTDIKKAGRDFAKREAERIAKVKRNQKNVEVKTTITPSEWKAQYQKRVKDGRIKSAIKWRD